MDQMKRWVKWTFSPFWYFCKLQMGNRNWSCGIKNAGAIFSVHFSDVLRRLYKEANAQICETDWSHKCDEIWRSNFIVSTIPAGNSERKWPQAQLLTANNRWTDKNIKNWSLDRNGFRIWLENWRSIIGWRIVSSDGMLVTDKRR